MARNIGKETSAYPAPAGAVHIQALERRRLLSASLIDLSAQNVSFADADAEPTQIVEFHGLGYFMADDGLHGREIWRTDGTPRGTQLFADLIPGTWGEVGVAGVLHDRLIFGSANTYTGANSQSFWTSDGTPQGTHPISESIAPVGTPMSVTANFLYLYKDTTHGTDVYRTDLVHPAQLLGTVNSISGDWAALSDGIAFFVRADPSDYHSGRNFYVVHDSGSLHEMAEFSWWGYQAIGAAFVGDTPYLFEPDGIYDFSGATPVQISSLHADRTSIAEFGGEVFFSTFADTTTNTPAKLYALDTATNRTTVLIDAPTGKLVTNSIPVQGELFFALSNLITGTELWATDGTAEGTRLIRHFDPGEPAPDYFYRAVGNEVFYEAAQRLDNQYPIFSMWRTDGTSPGTVPAPEWYGTINSYYSVSTEFNGNSYISLDRGRIGLEFYKSDGTLSGTTLLKDINRQPYSPPANLASDGVAAPDDATTSDPTPHFYVSSYYDLSDVQAVFLVDGVEVGRTPVTYVSASMTLPDSEALTPGPHQISAYFIDATGARSVATTPWTLVYEPELSSAIATSRVVPRAEREQPGIAAGLFGESKIDSLIDFQFATDDLAI